MQGVDEYVPRSLDELPRFFFLDLYQLVLLVIFVAVGLVMDRTLVGCLAGIAFMQAYARLRAGRHPQFFLHAAYWHLPAWLIPFRGLPASHMRYFVG